MQLTIDQVKSTYGGFIQAYAEQNGIPSNAGSLQNYIDVVSGIIERESQGNPNAIGDNGCSIGLMQLNTCAGTPQQFGYTPGADNLYDPQTNISYGCSYFNSLLNQYSLTQAISAYNAGSPIAGNIGSYVNVVLNYASQLGSTITNAFLSNPLPFILVAGVIIIGVVQQAKHK